MTTAIALETSKGDLPLAVGLGMVLIAIVVAVNALAWTSRRAGERMAAMNMRAPAADLPIIRERHGRSRCGNNLDRITLTLNSGPPTVLIGPNGSGKSTLLRVAMGLTAPSQGRITWGGRRCPADTACHRIPAPRDVQAQCRCQYPVCITCVRHRACRTEKPNWRSSRIGRPRTPGRSSRSSILRWRTATPRAGSCARPRP